MFKELVNAVRFLSIAQVNAANSGHLGMPLGMADCLTVLFRDFLIFDPKNPRWPNRDRFVLSAGHGSAALYSLLHLVGYEKISMNDLKKFRCLGSCTSGHPEYNLDAGIEVTTGLLGQGIANAVGMAIEERLLNARYGECINHNIYVCAGDGDLMEGVAHEASSIAGHLSLGKLIVLFDNNEITIDGSTNISNSDDILTRYKSYGWHVVEADGHNEQSIQSAITEAKLDNRPSLISCKTKIGYGSTRENTPSAHGGPLNREELNDIKKSLNWGYSLFEIPEHILKTWRVIGGRHAEECRSWYSKYSSTYGHEKFEYTEELRKVFRTFKKEYFVSRPFASTRVSSKNILNSILNVTPDIVSGSCDLGSSTGCYCSNSNPITQKDFSGNYIHYGVREHAMGSIMNGIVCGGKIRVVGGTFLVFSDYMRPAIRMSALMNIPTIFIFSHDSIGVGEDGPTHQPVEHISSLRCIPNLNIFRPSDAMETLECYEIALKSQRPCVLLLTRQDVLSVRFCGRTNLCEHGGYMLHDDSFDNTKKITIIVTGSEACIALEVKKMLNDKGVSVNIVSMPCFEIFDEQSDDYKREILGSGLIVGIEASNGYGWHKYIGKDGLFFGVNNFGNSCPASENYKFFGLTADNVFNTIASKLCI